MRRSRKVHDLALFLLAQHKPRGRHEAPLDKVPDGGRLFFGHRTSPPNTTVMMTDALCWRVQRCGRLLGPLCEQGIGKGHAPPVARTQRTVLAQGAAVAHDPQIPKLETQLTPRRNWHPRRCRCDGPYRPWPIAVAATAGQSYSRLANCRRVTIGPLPLCTNVAR